MDTTGELLTAAPADAPQWTEVLRGGLLVPAGVGLYGWGIELEEVFQGLERMLTEVGRTPSTRVLRFPPVIGRAAFERSEFAASFPQLFGAVHAFEGDRAQQTELVRSMKAGADWGSSTRLTDFVLTPAACYPVYSLHAGDLPAGGVTVDVSSFCFRHEPSTEPGRLVAFRQREFVRIADAATAQRWFGEWQQIALAAVRSLQIDCRLEVAADPFFGRGARLLVDGQREQSLKFEILAPIGAHPVAVASCNHHRDHFGRTFGIRSFDGHTAHTTCVGFGQERLALALVAKHGPVLGRWPAQVRKVLWG